MSLLSHLEAPYKAVGLTPEEVNGLLFLGEFATSLPVNSVFSWRDGKFYEAELLIRNMEEHSGSSVRVETRTRKHLGVALRRMLVLRRGPMYDESGQRELTDSRIV